MPRLSAAYNGYNHQDLMTACAFGSMLLPRAEVLRVSVERKAIIDDRFDDLELVGSLRRRVQVKSHTAQDRLLGVSDFNTNVIDFRIDRAVRSVASDPAPADVYTLFTTYPPSSDLLQFLEPTTSGAPLLPGLPSARFRLLTERVWPHGERPAWSALESVERQAFLSFSQVFVIETGCPSASRDLRTPGPLEAALLSLLHDGIGIGVFPNNNRDVADAAAHLIYAAQAVRVAGGTAEEQDVIRTLSLKIDYGRVQEQFPINIERSVEREDILEEVIPLLNVLPRLAVTLCANMTETSSVTAISEQGGKENSQNGNDEWHCQTRDAGYRNHRFGIG